MKYIEEFRQAAPAKKIAAAIKAEASPSRHYRFMEFCGGHTHAIHRYGIPSLLPENVEMIHGPGCPVCVLPVARIDAAIALAALPDVILCTYADMLRVPASNQQSLMQAKARGADIRMVYSVRDALNIARENPAKTLVFFAIGFETTTPPTAHAILEAYQAGLDNFTVFSNHVLTPVAMNSLLQDDVLLDGFVGPAHVSIIVGSQAYQAVCQDYQKPIVISGFEALDILQSILMLVRQVNQGIYQVENQYTRAVTSEGNLAAQSMIAEVFELRPQFEWRGLGAIADSALTIQAKYAQHDAEKRFRLPESPSREHPQCACPAVLRGQKKPRECRLFAKACTPQNPLGACMVSSEGACAAVYAYARGE